MGQTASIEVIVHAQAGYEPAATTVTAVAQEIGRLTGKPVEVVVRTEDYRFADDKIWDAASLDAIREPALAEAWPPGTALLHAFALAGCYDYSVDRPCIAAISGRSSTIFPRAAEGDTIPHDPALRDVPLRGWYYEERYLYVHELGHVLGLVASPLRMVEARLSDTDCHCHSVDPQSVMAFDGRAWKLPAVGGDPAEIAETVQTDNFERYTYSDRDLADVRAFQATEPR
jgi:hypothetical protein